MKPSKVEDFTFNTGKMQLDSVVTLENDLFLASYDDEDEEEGDDDMMDDDSMDEDDDFEDDTDGDSEEQG